MGGRIGPPGRSLRVAQRQGTAWRPTLARHSAHGRRGRGRPGGLQRTPRPPLREGERTA